MHESEAQRDLLATVAGLEPRDRRTRRAVTAITTLGVAALVILLCRGCGRSDIDAQEPETVAFVEAGTADGADGPLGPQGATGTDGATGATGGLHIGGSCTYDSSEGNEQTGTVQWRSNGSFGELTCVPD